MSRTSLIKEIRELLDNNLSEWVDIKDIILKNTEGMDTAQAKPVRNTIFVILTDMKELYEITFDRSQASQALMTTMQNQFPTDSVKVRTTLKYDREIENKSKVKDIIPHTVIHNSGTISNSAIGNNHSSLSNDFINPLTNIESTNKEQTKKRTSPLEKLYWVAGILTVIITLLVYFKIYPFNK